MFIKHLLASAGIAAVLAGSAIAESHASADVSTDAGTTMDATTAVDGADATATVEGSTSVEGSTTVDGTATPSTTTTAEATAETDAMVDVDIATVAPETLTGARVYDQNDKWIGEVSSVLVDSSGKAEKVVVDVGGFLGIGEKPVALNFDDLQVKSDGNAAYTVYVAMSEAELEEMPDYEG